MKSSCLRLGVLLVALSLAGCSRGPTYNINLSPAWKVGQKFLYVSDASSDSLITVTADPGSAAAANNRSDGQTVHAHLEAQGETLTIFPNGSVHKSAFTLQALTATNDSGPVTGLPAAGAKIVAERDEYGEENFTVDGQAASPDVTNLLRMLIVPGDPKQTNQYKLGPSKPVAVGEEWDINSAAFLEQRDKFPGAQAATGKMKLISIAGTGDGQVAEVQGQYAVTGMTPPSQMFTSGTGDLTGEYSGTIPAVTQGTMKEEFVMSIKVAGQALDPKSQGDVQISLASESHVAQQTTFQ
jgi:hypothetical protein